MKIEYNGETNLKSQNNDDLLPRNKDNDVYKRLRMTYIVKTVLLKLSYIFICIATYNRLYIHVIIFKHDE